MNEYNEQAVETLDDAGCIIANKNIIIDNLQARIAELEEENARLKAESRDASLGLNDYYGSKLAAAQAECEFQRNAHKQAEELMLEQSKQLAAEQLNNKLLRDALQAYIDDHEECQDADDWMAMMCSIEAHHVADEALSTPPSTTALQELITEVERRTIERCAEVCEAVRANDGDGQHNQWYVGIDGCAEAIRALPTGNLKLEDL